MDPDTSILPEILRFFQTFALFAALAGEVYILDSTAQCPQSCETVA